MTEKNFSRRSMLKGIGVGGSMTVLPGVASAREGDDPDFARPAPRRVEELRSTYMDPAAVDRVVEAHAADVLEELEAEGYLDEASVDALPTETIHDDKRALPPEERLEGAAVDAITWDGEETAVISASVNTDTHSVSVYVQPERGESYAFVEKPDGTVRTVTTGTDCCPNGTWSMTSCSPTGCQDMSLFGMHWELECCCSGRCENYRCGYTCKFKSSGCFCPGGDDFPC